MDARTQITQTRIGRPLKRVAYYLKRGYYPPDQEELADTCLVRLTNGQRLGETTRRKLMGTAHSLFWVYPVQQYPSSNLRQPGSPHPSR